MKVFLFLAVFCFAHFKIAFSQNQDWLDVSQTELKILRDNFSVYGYNEDANRKADLLFLIDTSGSLSGSEFNEEKKFITNLLNEISVGYEATRVEVIPFGSTASRFIQQISAPDRTKNKCTFNEQFNPMPQSIEGYATNMKEAFRLAEDVCIGAYSGEKRGTLATFRTAVLLITDGIWNRPRSDPSPVEYARDLLTAGAEIFAIAVGDNVDYDNLKQVVDDPTKRAFHLKDFDQFAELATYLRGGNMVLL